VGKFRQRNWGTVEAAEARERRRDTRNEFAEQDNYVRFIVPMVR